MTYVDESKRQRKRSERVRTACITCKKRHLKCGEEKPECTRCKSAKRTCNYELTTVQYRSSPSKEPTSDLESVITYQPPQAFQGEDLRGLSFFLDNVADTVDRRVPDLWKKTVPQLATQNSALRHALVALSGVHEHKTCGTILTQHSLKQYNMAIRSLLTATDQTDALNDQLLGCLLFIVIEFLHGNLTMAVELVKAGRRIVYASRNCKKTATQQFMYRPIEDTFRRLDAELSAICDGTLDQDLSFSRCWNFDRPQNIPNNFHFKDFAGALRSLGLLMNLWSVARADGWYDQVKFHKALQTWYDKFRLVKDGTKYDRCSLMVWYITNDMLVLMGDTLSDMSICTFVCQADWDKYQEWFERMVALAEEIDSSAPKSLSRFSLCPGISTNMCHTAMRCKDPIIRRRAVKVIRSENRQQGFLKTEWMLKIARRTIELEEEGLVVTCAADIPEDARIRDFRLHWKTGGNPVPMAHYYFKDRLIAEPLE